MSNQCINQKCQSKPKRKLFIAKKPVCNYYNVHYRPNLYVCRLCRLKSIVYICKISKRFKNKECILDVTHPKSRIRTFELSDSDDDNATEQSIENPDPQTGKLTTSLNAFFKDTVQPLIIKQDELYKSYLNSKKDELAAGNEELNNLKQQVDTRISRMYNNLYKYDSKRKFEFEKEISILDKVVKCEPVDNDVVIVKTKKLTEFPDDLPVGKNPKRHLLKLGDKVYGMKYSLLEPWVEATIILAVSETEFNIMFKDGEEKILSQTNIACINALSDAQYKLGSRVIAKIQDMNIQDEFYAGIIAEPPKYLNNFRYMIFFDAGYTQYVHHKNIRLVYEAPLYLKNVHENIRVFAKKYFHYYPERPMVKFNENQIVSIELNNIWHSAKVKKLDASLVQLKFFNMNFEHTEWVYRGSERLGPIFNKLSSNNKVKHIRVTNVNKLLNRPYIELETLTNNEKSINIAKNYNSNNTKKIQKPQQNNGEIKSIEIPSNCPKPLPKYPHQCSHFCLSRVNFNYNQTKNMNVLSIPLHYGFRRSIIKDKKLKVNRVTYTTPCGYNIDNEGKMYNYLKATECGNSQMTIDLFNFDCKVNPLSLFSIPEEFICIQDISYDREFKTISVVNSLNDLVPKPTKYITKRITTPGINLNEDLNFLCGCDCTDNCEDRNKCSCWKLTYEGPKNYPTIFKDHDDIGYSFKRLHEQVITGIFECNQNCKCSKTCLNRVVQEPMKSSLQLFLTKKKGWGVRTLADIPKGSFICTYLGVVRTEDDTENDSSSNWGEYLADLDFLETVENFKDGYESNVDQSEDENNDCTSLCDDEEFDPGWEFKHKTSIVESRMSLRKNLPKTNTQIDAKHELSKFKTQQRVESMYKSLRLYLDKDCCMYTLDSNVSGNIGRYFNHSCDPNMFVQNVFIDTHDPRFPWVAYFALSNISAGTELAWDYNYVVGSVINKILQCDCGSKNCRGRLL